MGLPMDGRFPARDGVWTLLMGPRFRRELILRGGITLLFAAIAALLLDAGPWIWAAPVGVAALVAVKWLLAPAEDAAAVKSDSPPDPSGPPRDANGGS